MNPTLRHYLQHLAAVFAALVLIATLAGLAGCGGGSMGAEPGALLAEGDSSASGGSAGTGAAALAVPLLGPNATVATPTQALVTVHLTWRVQVQPTAEPATLELAAHAGLGNPPGPLAWASAGTAIAPTTTASAILQWHMSLPAGTTALAATARLRARSASGTPLPALGPHTAQATWTVHAQP